MESKVWICLGIAVFLLAVPVGVRAQNCTDIIFSVPESAIAGSLFKVSVTTDSGVPEDPWGNYTNVTLDLETGLVNMTAPLFIDLQTAIEATQNWGLNSTGLGTYQVNATFFEDDGSSCTLSDSVIARNSTDPFVIVGPLPHIPQMELGPFDINASLANNGTGTAYNLTVGIELPGFNQSTPLADLPVGSIVTPTFTVTPTICGVQSIWVQANYRNSLGEEMPSSYDTDSFEVVGSDLMVENLTCTVNSTPVGSTITLTTKVKNMGQYNSSGYMLTFYKREPLNNVQIGSQTHNTNLSEQGTDTTQFNWTVDEGGTYRLYVVVSSTNDCVTDSGNEGWFELTGTSSCGDGYCTGGETCSTCPSDCGTCSSGGSSGGSRSSGGGGYWSGPSCTVNWTCTEWEVCSPEGVQTRTCTDVNECGTEVDRPEGNRSCVYVPPAGEKVCTPAEVMCSGNKVIFCNSHGTGWGLAETCQHGCSGGMCVGEVREGFAVLGDITGFFVANSGYIGGGILVILVVAGLYLYLMRKKGWEGWDSQSGGTVPTAFEPRSGAPEAPILDQSRTASQEQRSDLTRRPSLLDRIKDIID